MYHSENVRFALGIIGNISSCAFFLSSAPTIYKILRNKTTGGLSGDLYVFMLFNCLLWIFYGTPIVHPNDFWVLVTNACGAFLAILYIIPCLYYGSKKQQLVMVLELAITFFVFLLLVGLLLKIEHNRSTRITIVGITCVIISSFMHLSLLSQMGLILRTKNPRYMHPYSSVGAFVKGAIWSAYGVIDLDLYILIPNGVGVATGLFQCTIFAAVMMVGSKKNTSSIEPTSSFIELFLKRCVGFPSNSAKILDHNGPNDSVVVIVNQNNSNDGRDVQKNVMSESLHEIPSSAL